MMCGRRARKLPRWIGMCSAWQSVSPAALNSAVEQSRRSLMLVECEARISVSPVSSTIEAMAAPITSMVMGSRLVGCDFMACLYATQPHPEERAAGPRLEGWEGGALLPLLRDGAGRPPP